MATRNEDDRERISKQARAAWQRLKKERSWTDWLAVGEGLVMWRAEAMRDASVNAPVGKGYNMAFAERLANNKLDDMDKGDRSRLFQCMDNIALIEDWRRTLPLTARLKLNHPSTVWRAWKRAMEPEAAPTGEPKPTLRDSVANLSQDLEAQRAHADELQAALDAARTESHAAWVAALMDQPYAERAKALHALMLELDLSLSHLDDMQAEHRAKAAPASKPRRRR